MIKPFLQFSTLVLLILNLSGLNSSLYAQQENFQVHFEKYYQAEKAFLDGDYKAAKTGYLDLFENTEFGDLGHIYNTLIKACIMEDTTLVKILGKSGVRKGASIYNLQKVAQNKKCGSDGLYAALITSELETSDSMYYAQDLDSFLISELVHLQDRDQLFRDEEYSFKIPEKYDKFTDSINFLVLKKLIELEGGKLPPYKKIGVDGSRALSTLLYHLEIEMISEIFPAITKSIRLGEFYDAETILYQIDRNHVGGNTLYRYDKETGHLKAFGSNTLLHPKLGNYQYYGSMDISDMKTRTVNFWPFHPEVDQSVQQEMYDALLVLPPFENPRKAHMKKRTDQEFIDLLLHQN